MQRLVPSFGDGVNPGLLDLRRQRQHGAENLPDRRQVVVRNPLTQLHQRGIKHRLGVQNLKDSLGLHGRLAVMQRRDHAGEPLIAERNQHAGADHRRRTGNLVGKRHVQRDRQDNVAERGHGGQG